MLRTHRINLGGPLSELIAGAGPLAMQRNLFIRHPAGYRFVSDSTSLWQEDFVAIHNSTRSFGRTLPIKITIRSDVRLTHLLYLHSSHTLEWFRGCLRRPSAHLDALVYATGKYTFTVNLLIYGTLLTTLRTYKNVRLTRSSKRPAGSVVRSFSYSHLVVAVP